MSENLFLFNANLNHPPYSPEPVPAVLFPLLNLALNRKRFSDISDNKVSGTILLKTVRKEDFFRIFQQLYERYQKHVVSVVDYYEGQKRNGDDHGVIKNCIEDPPKDKKPCDGHPTTVRPREGKDTIDHLTPAVSPIPENPPRNNTYNTRPFNNFIDSHYAAQYLRLVKQFRRNPIKLSAYRDKHAKRLVLKQVVPAFIWPLTEIFREVCARNIFRGMENFVDFYGHYEIATEASVVFNEFYAGCPIDVAFARRLMPPTRVKIALRKILSGISSVHQKDCMLRNISSTSILIDKQDVVKILDFRFFEVQKATGFVGSIGYAAPEILAHYFDESAPPYGKCCDIFSVGATIYLNMIGRFPGYWSRYVLGEFGYEDHEKYHKFLDLAVPTEEDLDFPRDFDPLLEDLLRKLLNPDFRERITADEALLHPYFTNEDHATTTGIEIPLATEGTTASEEDSGENEGMDPTTNEDPQVHSHNEPTAGEEVGVNVTTDGDPEVHSQEEPMVLIEDSDERHAFVSVPSRHRLLLERVTEDTSYPKKKSCWKRLKTCLVCCGLFSRKKAKASQNEAEHQTQKPQPTKKKGRARNFITHAFRLHKIE